MTTLQLRKSPGRSPLRLAFLLIPLALCGFALSPMAASLHAAPPLPSGVFYLPSMGTIDTTALSIADGVVIGARWSDLEPNQSGVYNWTQLDALLNTVAQHPKPMRLEIDIGGPDLNGGPDTCLNSGTPTTGYKPHWLIQAIQNDTYQATKFFTYIISTDSMHTYTATIPVFWEPTLLAEHAILVQAVHDHILTTYPVLYALLKVVFVPYANAQTDDWNIGDTSQSADGLCSNCTPNINCTPTDRWLATLIPSDPNHIYDTMEHALEYAGNQTYIAYHTAFPDKLLTTSIGRLQNTVLNPGGGGMVNGRNISETVVSTANINWQGYIVAQKENLNGGCPSLPCSGGVPPAPGGTSAWNDLSRLHTMYGIPTAAQMVWHAYNDIQGCQPPVTDNYYAQRMDYGFGSPCMDSTLMLYQAVNTGITYATQWQELYELDILNLGSAGRLNMDPHPPPGVPSQVITYAHQKLFRCSPPCQ